MHQIARKCQEHIEISEIIDSGVESSSFARLATVQFHNVSQFLYADPPLKSWNLNELAEHCDAVSEIVLLQRGT